MSTVQKRIDDVAETVLADSWFGSVKALCHTRKCEIGTKKEVIFQVKTNRKGFPKKYIAKKSQTKQGEYAVLHAYHSSVHLNTQGRENFHYMNVFFGNFP